MLKFTTLNKQTIFGLLSACLSISLVIIGCTTRQENIRYFAVASLPNSATAPATTQLIRFYRVIVNGQSYGTNAQLQTGNYPAEALHNLFGEVKATTQRATDQIVVNVDADGASTVLDAESRFTVLYGANAQAVADQIKFFATTQESGNQLAALLVAASGAGRVEEAKRAEVAADAQETSAQSLAKKLREIAKSLPTTEPTTKAVAAVQQGLIAAAQAELESLGSKTQLPTTEPSTAFSQAQAVYSHLTTKD
jgi:hypothetical protein